MNLRSISYIAAVVVILSIAVSCEALNLSSKRAEGHAIDVSLIEAQVESPVMKKLTPGRGMNHLSPQAISFIQSEIQQQMEARNPNPIPSVHADSQLNERGSKTYLVQDLSMNEHFVNNYFPTKSWDDKIPEQEFIKLPKSTRGFTRQAMNRNLIKRYKDTKVRMVNFLNIPVNRSGGHVSKIIEPANSKAKVNNKGFRYPVSNPSPEYDVDKGK